MGELSIRNVLLMDIFPFQKWWIFPRNSGSFRSYVSLIMVYTGFAHESWWFSQFSPWNMVIFPMKGDFPWLSPGTKRKKSFVPPSRSASAASPARSTSWGTSSWSTWYGNYILGHICELYRIFHYVYNIYRYTYICIYIYTYIIHSRVPPFVEIPICSMYLGTS